ncbi:class II aaRS and biotin synthetase [Byssothecium circinans]|uniref:Class II aaRS and biotin synthetase n=1 Tax=Byssothecium circinans TaxID=147558 RepID=A0A6A5TWV4_9PLEO|nr:class II aaRS and biotin synthetase [Byssothecium circinans]
MDMSCTTFPVLPRHVFFRNRRIVAGLSRYPTTRGESLVTLEQPSVHLFSLDRQEFLEVMSNVKHLAHALRDFYEVGRCALVTEGNGSISIVPLHGLEKSWKPVTSHEKEFQETFPGYISSKDGLAMDSGRLSQITATIRRETGLKEPLNHHFNGDHRDSNLFARIVRGEISQSRVWEDGEHVAFLTPFANTPGFTVLVPREHLTSDIFSIEDTNYAKLMDASYTLAGYLMKAFGVPRCGMIFEGFEIDYAHVKLIPIHSREVYKSWYENLFTIQNSLFHSSVGFFKRGVNYKYAIVPATTNAISSPMGLGSDSQPVPITLLGQKTYLVDSMQFALESSLRIQDGLDGVYYINTSFRGEDSDAMHLNQFDHVECELAGDFDQGISVAERDTIEASVGTTEHLTAFLELYQRHDQKLPRITLEEPLGLPEMDQTCWKYVVPDNKAHGRTITRAGEQKLIQHFGGAVWLTEMDHLSVPFYQAYLDSASHSKARCADLLFGNGEVLGLGERHVSSEEVRIALQQHEVPEESYKWYLDMRDQKEMRTTGWGTGIERFLAWVFRHDDIRDWW